MATRPYSMHHSQLERQAPQERCPLLMDRQFSDYSFENTPSLYMCTFISNTQNENQKVRFQFHSQHLVNIRRGKFFKECLHPAATDLFLVPKMLSILMLVPWHVGRNERHLLVKGMVITLSARHAEFAHSSLALFKSQLPANLFLQFGFQCSNCLNDPRGSSPLIPPWQDVGLLHCYLEQKTRISIQSCNSLEVPSWKSELSFY